MAYLGNTTAAARLRCAVYADALWAMGLRNEEITDRSKAMRDYFDDMKDRDLTEGEESLMREIRDAFMARCADLAS